MTWKKQPIQRIITVVTLLLVSEGFWTLFNTLLQGVNNMNIYQLYDCLSSRLRGSDDLYKGESVEFVKGRKADKGGFFATTEY